MKNPFSLIKWDKFSTYLIIGFLVVLGLFFANEAKAETRLEASPFAFVGGSYRSSFGVSVVERIADKYDFGAILLVTQVCPDKSCAANQDIKDKRHLSRDGDRGNMGVFAQRVAGYKDFEAGIGVAYWQNETESWNKPFTFALSLGWKYKHFDIRWRHFSTGGTSARNKGLDLLTIGYDF